MPSFAIELYAPANSRGEIPWSSPPKARARFTSLSFKVVIPIFLKYLIDTWGVSCSISFTKGIFWEDSTACLKVIDPL